MYAKVFRQIYDSTLAEDWRALVTFQQFLVLADAQGVVDMTPGAIHRVTNIPQDIIDAGIEKLQQPDPISRSDKEEGRRLVLIDPNRNWGWKIVNHEKYREIRSQEDRRKYMRTYMQGYRKQHVNDCKPELAQLADTEAEAEADTKNKGDVETHVSTPIPFEKILNLYHESLPELPRCIKLTQTRRGYMRQRWLEDLPDLEAWKKYFEIVRASRFLMGKTPPRNGSPPFRATLDWLCRPENCCKVVEGKYG